MDLTYIEIKESSEDTYINSYERRGETLTDTFYSHLDDHISHEECDFTEELSVYISFASILIENKKDISFIVKEMLPLIKKADTNKIKEELNIADYKTFENDLTLVKKYMVIT